MNIETKQQHNAALKWHKIIFDARPVTAEGKELEILGELAGDDAIL